MNKMKLKKLNVNLLFIFLIYTALRLFLKFKAYWIWGDEAKYLACAKSFPFNRMFNNSYYDFHPVFYPYTIRFLSLFFKDHIAAIAVSFFSSIVLFFVIYRLLKFLGLKRSLVYVALLYMAFNDVLLSFAKIPFRYELFAALFFLCFYLYLKGITSLKTGYLLLSALFGGLTFMVSDMMPFVLLPALLGAFFVFNFNRHDKFTVQFRKILPIVLIVAIYITCVLLPKFIIYSTHTYYAGGVEGRIEKVSDFGLKQLIHPVYFPNVYEIWGKSQLTPDLKLGHILNRVFSVIQLRKYDDAFYNWILFLLILIPIVVLFYKLLFRERLFSKKKFIDTEPLQKHKVDLYLAFVTLGILYPVIYSGFLSRNAIAAIPFLAYFLSQGAGGVFSFRKFKNPKVLQISKVLAVIAILVMTGAIMKKNRNFIFTLGRVEASSQAGTFLNGLPKDGVLSEGLIGDALVYNCNKRVVILPRSPDAAKAIEQTELSIDVFDLNYAVISELWKIEVDSLAYPTAEYIKNTPERFKLIKVLHENYDSGISSNAMVKEDTFYIYEIIKDSQDSDKSKK